MAKSKINFSAAYRAYKREREQKEMEDVQSFFSDSYSYLNDEINRFNASDYDTISGNSDAFGVSSLDWRKRAENAKSYLEQNKSSFSDEDYKSYLDYVDAFNKQLDQFGTDYTDRKKFYSSFESKDAYDMWDKASKLDIEEWVNPSSNPAYESILSVAEQIAADKEKESVGKNNGTFPPISTLNPAGSDAFGSGEQALLNLATSIENGTIDEHLSEEEQALLDLARNIQYGQKFSGLTDEQKTEAVNSKAYRYTDERGEEKLQTITEDEWEWLNGGGYYDTLSEKGRADQYKEKKLMLASPEFKQNPTISNGNSFVNRYETEQLTEDVRNFTRDNTLLSNLASVAASPLKALGSVETLVNQTFNPNSEIDPYSKSFRVSNMINAVREETSKNMGAGGQFFYNTGMSILENGLNMLLTQGSGVAIGILMGSQVATDTIMNAKQKGLTDSQALASGIASGVAEALFEKFSVEKLMDAAKSGGAGFKNFVKNFFKQGGVEASEEFFTEIANIITDTVISGELSDYNLAIREGLQRGLSYDEAVSSAQKGLAAQIGEAAAAGFVSGGVFGFGGQVTNALSNRFTGNDIIKGGTVDAVLNQAEGFAPDSATAYRLADYKNKTKNGGKASPSYIGAVYRAMANDSYSNLTETRKTEIRSYIENQLTENGIESSKKLVDAIEKKVYAGESLSKAEETLVNSNKAVSDLVEKFTTDSAFKNAPFQSEAFKEAAEKVGGVDQIAFETNVKNAVLKDYNVTKNAAEIDSIEVKDNGDVYIVQDGKSVEANKAKVNTDTAFALAYGESMSPAKKREYFAHYNDYVGEGKMGIDDYHNYFDLTYSYGQNKMSISKAQETASGKFSDEDILSIYMSGLKNSKSAKEDVKNVSSEIRKALGMKEREAGKIDDSEVRYSKIKSAERRAILGFAEVLAVTTGRNIKLYDSTAKERNNGKANGYYDPKTNTIYIDVNAGMQVVAKEWNSTILSTLSHELVHIFKTENLEGYNQLKDIVLETLSEQKGKSIKTLIDEDAFERYGIKATKEGKYIYEQTGEEVSAEAMKKHRAVAEEELVARSCEDMLAESRVMKEFIQKMENKDSKLAQKFSDMLGRAIEKLKEIFENVFRYQASRSDEAKAIRQAKDDMIERWQAIKDQYDALLERRAETVVAEEVSVEIDENSESASPMMMSERTWNESEYVTKRNEAAKALSEALGVSVKKAKSYIDSVNSVAKAIADDRARLDYEASSFGSAFVSNVEYGGSFDFSTICKKRRLYTGTFSEIQKRIGENALSAEDILRIRNLMIDGGFEATCGLCYVEGSRANMGKFAKEFIRLYKRDNPDAWIPKMADVNTPDGVEQMRINHPECYEQYEYFWNHYGKLQDSDPALFASQQKPKLYEARKEYKNEILKLFENVEDIAKKNINGGIRFQSFSDFELVHLIDTMQIIMDMSRVGLSGQAYTKVPEFAEAFGNTGLKINLSLIAKGVDENGRIIFDDREGMPHERAFDLRNKYSKNVGTIIVTFTDEQLYAAMADSRIDFIIPFHRSQWKKKQYEAMGLPKGTKDYTYQQNEKLIKKTYHEYRGRMVLDKAKNYMPNEYWDFSLSGKENAENYLKMCAENNKRPKFYKLLDNNGDGSYSLKKDGSTDGYWKLLIDFKMYDNNGVGSPQMPVTPDFSMQESMKMLEEYKGGHDNYPIAHGVVDQFMEEYNGSSNGIMKQDREISEKFTEEDREIEQSVIKSIRNRAVGARVLDGYATYTPERMERELFNSTAKGVPDYAKSYITWVDPLDFIYATTISDKNREQIEEEAGQFDYEKLKNETQPIHLTVDFSTGEIVGHEGRHRMTALHKNGINKVAIIIDAINDDRRNTKPIDIMKLKGQEFGANAHGTDMFLHDMLPLSNRYADIARKYFTTPTKSGVMYSERKVEKKSKSYYNEFNTNAMQWANSSSRNQNDVKILYDPRRKQYYLIGVSQDSDMGFIELNSGTRFQMEKEMEEYANRIYVDSTTEEFDKVVENAKVGNRNDSWDNELPRYRGEEGSNGAVSSNTVRKWEQKTDGAGDFAGAETNPRGVMSQDRVPYQSARDILLSYAEDSKNVKARSEYLNEYVERVKRLDLKNRRYEDAVSNLATATDSGDKEKIALYKKRVENLEKTINQISSDLNAMEESKELKAIVRREKAATAEQYQDEIKEIVSFARKEAKANSDWAEAEKKFALEYERAKHRHELELAQEEISKTKRQAKEYERHAKKEALANLDWAEAKERFAVQWAVAKERHKAKQAVDEQRKRLSDYRDSLERNNRIDRIEAKVSLLGKKILANNKELHIPDELKEPILDFIEAIDYTSKKNRKGKGATVRELRLSELLSNARKEMMKHSLLDTKGGTVLFSADIWEQMDAMEKNLQGFRNEMSENVLLDMSTEQLRDLDFFLSSVTRALNSIERAFADSGKATVYAEGEAAYERLLGMKDQKQSDKTAEERTTVSGLVKGFTWGNMTPQTAFARLGKAGEAVYRSIVDGWGEFAFKSRQILDFAEQNWNAKQVKAWEDSEHEIEFEHDGKKETGIINDTQLMYLYLVDKREQGQLHLDGLGIVLPEQGKSAKSRSIEFNYAQRQKLYDKYIPEGSEQRKVADAIQRFFVETCAKWGNETSLALYGYTPFTDQNYVPLVTDTTTKGANAETSVIQGMYAILNMGFTKSLQANAKNPIVATNLFDVFANHTADMAKYNALGRPILDAVRFLNFNRVDTDPETGLPVRTNDTLRAEIDRVYGSKATKYFEQFLIDLNGSNKHQSDDMESIASQLMQNFKVSAVSFSLKSISIQPTSYFRATKVLSVKSMSKALALLSNENGEIQVKKSEKYRKLAQQYSGMAAWKALGYFDVNIGRSLTEQVKGTKTFRDKAIEQGTKGMAFMDEVTIGALYKACLIEVNHSADAKGLSAEEIRKKAGKLLDEVIVKTQVVDSTVTRSQNMRSKSFFTKSISAFMSEPTVSFNLLMDAMYGYTDSLKNGMKMREAFRANKKNIGRSIATYALTGVASALLEAVFGALRDDDDEEFYKKYLEVFPKSLYENLAVHTKIPYLSDADELAKILKSGYVNISRMEYEGINDVFVALRKGYKLIESDEPITTEKLYAFLKALFAAASSTTGIAFGNVLREIEDAWNNTFGAYYDMKLRTK